MNRSMVEENGELKDSSYVKQESANYNYDTSYVNFPTNTATPTSLNQPLPGQPPLPPMPPPQGSVPPPPSVFGPVPTQVTQIHAWPHAPTWQWITPQPTPLPPQSPRDIAAATFQREMPLRNNYIKRERFNHNRNNLYAQRGNFQRKKRMMHRFDNMVPAHNQFDQALYFGATLSNSIMSHMQIPIQNQLTNMTATVPNTPRSNESADQDVKEEVIKKKQRKPMSQSYPSRPWDQEDAERALKTENEFNKIMKAQSLIIKFPDPDLNKEIVKKFHSGIQNIHFQSPSGPRYCFVQMEKSVDIDEAIKELEKIPFGVGHLKVERKSLRDEDDPTPLEIDPYTLYIGNLPESVNVNEIKSKFPSAVRIDVGFAQRIRNTRYAFIRYNSVDESISAYKKAHDLMWDTRSIIVRFRRQRGSTSFPGEQKPKKIKDESAKAAPVSNDIKTNEKVSNEKEKNHITSSHTHELQNKSIEVKDSVSISNSTDTTKSLTVHTHPVSITENNEPQIKQTLVPEQTRTTVSSNESMCTMKESELKTNESIRNDATTLITDIKEEPAEYDEMNEMFMEEDDIDDDDDEGEIYNQDGIDDDSDYDDELSDLKPSLTGNSRKLIFKDDIPSDHLDQMFNDLENTAGDIEL